MNIRIPSQSKTPKNIPQPTFSITHMHKTPPKTPSAASSSPFRILMTKGGRNSIQKTPSNEPSSIQQKWRSMKDEQGRKSAKRGNNKFELCCNPKIKIHEETYKFIHKNFAGEQKLPIEAFIDKILKQYDYLWGKENNEKILNRFTIKINDFFGNQTVNTDQLIQLTQDNGMIGFLLQIFKSIKRSQVNEQNKEIQIKEKCGCCQIQYLKNVIQQFMETMYKCIQNEIYSKFNTEMRRMVIKYGETERNLKKINEKLVEYADIFQMQKSLKAKEQGYQSEISKLSKEKKQLEQQLEKERNYLHLERKQSQSIREENQNLNKNLQKFHNALFAKTFEPNRYSLTNTNPNKDEKIQKIKPFIPKNQGFYQNIIVNENKQNNDPNMHNKKIKQNKLNIRDRI